ncbi:hypothetical protein M1E11_14990 [Bacillus sp. JZ8]
MEAYWRIRREISYEVIPIEALDLVQKMASSLHVNHADFDVAVCNGKMYLFEI